MQGVSAEVAEGGDVVVVGMPVGHNCAMTPRSHHGRISQKDENTPAVVNQIEACRQIAADAGYTVEAVFSDDGISAYSGKDRPGFLDLLTGIEAGRFDVVMAVAEDRFTRSTSEKLAFSSICTKAGVTWHTKATGKLDPSTAEVDYSQR